MILSAGKELGQWRFMPVMSIDQALERRQAIVDATKKLMREGTDYGKISRNLQRRDAGRGSRGIRH